MASRDAKRAFSVQGDIMAEVRIDSREDFEKALRRFMMQCKKEGIVKNFRERQHYTKPSQKRREKKKKRT